MKNLLSLYKTMFEFASVYKQAAVLAIVGLFTLSLTDAVAQTLTTTTKVTDSSGTKEITSSDTIGSGSGNKLNTGITPEKAKKDAEAASKTDSDRKEEAQDVKYTGLYNGRQIVPDIMAIYCKTNGEEFLADTSKLDRCLNKYLAAMNSPNAALKAEGKDDYQALRLRVMLDAMAVAVTKSASVANYEEAQNKMADSSRKAQTEREDGAAMSNTTSVATDVMNSIRELLAVDMFKNAIDGMETVSPDVLDEEVVDEVNSAADDKRDVSGEMASYNIESTTHMESDAVSDEDFSDEGEYDADYDGGAMQKDVTTETSNPDASGLFVGQGKCSAGGTPVTCTDGEHKDQYGREYICDGGICVLKKLDEASQKYAITPDSENTNSKKTSSWDIECYHNGIKMLCWNVETRHMYTPGETECKKEGDYTTCYVREGPDKGKVMYSMKDAKPKNDNSNGNSTNSNSGVIEGGMQTLDANGNPVNGNNGMIEGGMQTLDANGKPING